MNPLVFLKFSLGLLLWPCLLVLLLTQTACEDRAPSTRDSWYRAPPQDVKWQVLNDWSIVKVPDMATAEAIRKLESTNTVQLSSEEFNRVIGSAALAPPNTKPYLVRGLRFNKGLVRVFLADDKLHVTHNSGGKHQVSMTRQPVIVFLDRAPVEVYVTCFIDE